MKTTLAFLLALVCLTSAHARIGETERQIEARYGKAAADLRETGVISHHRNGKWDIIVHYRGGKSIVESFSRKDNGKLTLADVQRLLALSSEGGRWIPGARISSDGPLSIRGLVPGDGTIEWTQNNGRRATFIWKYQDLSFD